MPRQGPPLQSESADATQRAPTYAELLMAAMNHSSDFLLLVDYEDLRFLGVNDAFLRMRGLTREQVLASKPWELLVEKTTREELVASYDQVLAAAPRPVRSTRVRVHAETGATMSYEIQRQAMKVDGRWIVLVIGRDVSQRVRAEAELRLKMRELERSNAELERYAYVISHDLSEPLRMIGSFAQLLERRYADRLDADAQEFIGYVVDGARRMKSLVDDLLLYARFGRRADPMTLVPLDSALDDALANLGERIAQTAAVIRRQPLPSIHGDRAAMTQVFQNLLGNAIKFHRPEIAPEIDVTVESSETEWIIAVRDNGIGIEAEYFDRVFVLFQRLHPRDRYEGTGIGLAICKKVVEQHGGSIELASEPGTGSCFTIRLPHFAQSG